MNIFDFKTQDLTHGVGIIFLCCVLVVLATLIDMWTGIEAARKNKERICSHSLRKTVRKMIDYLRIVMFAVLIDILGLFFPWYAIPYCAIIVTLGVLLIEGKSVIENYRKKKSSASEILDIVRKIIECADKPTAEKIITAIKNESYGNKRKWNKNDQVLRGAEDGSIQVPGWYPDDRIRPYGQCPGGTGMYREGGGDVADRGYQGGGESSQQYKGITPAPTERI